jgi:hypothetical protein
LGVLEGEVRKEHLPPIQVLDQAYQSDNMTNQITGIAPRFYKNAAPNGAGAVDAAKMYVKDLSLLNHPY